MSRHPPLGTLTGEEHTLDLLMVAALLSSHGIPFFNLGSDIPNGPDRPGSTQFHIDVAGISFSEAYPYRNIRPHPAELREQIPDAVDVWTGAEDVHRLRKLPLVVTRYTSLENQPPLQEIRARSC